MHEGNCAITCENGTQAEKDAAFYAVLEIIGPDREFTVHEGPDGKSGWSSRETQRSAGGVSAAL